MPYTALRIVTGSLPLASAISAYDRPRANSVSISGSRAVSLFNAWVGCGAPVRSQANTRLITSPGMRYSPSATSRTVRSRSLLPEYF